MASQEESSIPTTSFDIVIVGAGVSGLNTAYRLQTSLPSATFTVLESRSSLGGTWDFFRYPGVRSDSNLWTFGFAWRPWTGLESIASGIAIRNYLKDSAAASRIDEKIQCNNRLQSASWSSESQSWTLTVGVATRTRTIKTAFLLMCTGYYNYLATYPAHIPNISSFGGQVLHPQNWPSEQSSPHTRLTAPNKQSDEVSPLPYAGKRVIVIGSGATAITMVPALAQHASHVTMLQRSPTYIASVPRSDPLVPLLREWLPDWLSNRIIRFKYLIMDTILMQFTAYFPEQARKVLRDATRAELLEKIPLDPHFDPKYMPGQQRLCLTPDGEFFESLRCGRTSITTGEIDTVYEQGVRLKSGQKLEGDVIVTATGMEMQLGGSAQILVNGKAVKLGEKFLWNMTMLSDIPNLALVLDFANASWTLGADVAATTIIRVLKHMNRNGIGSATARLPITRSFGDGNHDADGPVQIEEQLWCWNLTSTYIVNARGSLPRTLHRAPWQPRGTYLWNWWTARLGSVQRDMEYEKRISL